MHRPLWKKLIRLPKEQTGFVEGAATLLTALMFVLSYFSRSLDLYTETEMQGLFLFGATVLCGIVIYGVLVRHFIPFISHMIVVGASMIILSRVSALLSRIPSLSHLPIIGPEGRGYLVHHDDMLLYPGFILMLGGFYLAILHAGQLRQALLREGGEKEMALERSEESATTLARRVAFENLATGISTRFLNLSQDEIAREMNRSLEELGQFANVDRAYITFSRLDKSGVGENFDWHGPGLKPFDDEILSVAPENFPWAIKVLGKGETIAVHCLSDLPDAAHLEVQWFARQEIKSIIIVPIISNRKLRGYIGFDSVTREIAWHDEMEPLLRVIGEILLSVWDRRCADQQRNLLEMQVQQAQKLESLGVMAGGIAHDFNNLLTGIMGNTELAQLDMAEDSNGYRYLEGVLQSSRRAAELCRQMLAYAGRGKFVTQSIELNRLINDMLPLLQASASRRTEFQFDLAEDLPPVNGDMGQFRQIMGNLVTNAAESLGDQVGTVFVQTGVRRCDESFFRGTYLADALPPGEYVFLEIKDTGSGMEEHVKERIFEPFFTTRFAGRGLGLPAVLGIVRGHRGTLTLESEVGVGTSIKLYFPVKTVGSASWLVTGEVQGDWHGHGTVLIADDEDMILSVGTMMLRHLGLNVVTATNGNEVLERAQTHIESLQCIILDYEMPGTECNDVCSKLKSELPDVPIVVSSGHAQRDLIGHFDDKMIAAFLPKPFELAGLQAVLREILTPV